jgi:hypothetical protein
MMNEKSVYHVTAKPSVEALGRCVNRIVSEGLEVFSKICYFSMLMAPFLNHQKARHAFAMEKIAS